MLQPERMVASNIVLEQLRANSKDGPFLASFYCDFYLLLS